MSYSYAIVDRRTRAFIIVNGEYSDCVYVIIDITPRESGELSKLELFGYSEGIQTKTLVFDGILHDGLDEDDGPPYAIFRLIFTSNNNGSLVTSSRYLALNKRGKALDYVMDEDEYQSSIWYAKLVLWCDCLLKDLPKAIEDVVEISRFVKEREDEEGCVICREEYQSDCMIGTLRCKHNFHEECIKNWLRRKKTKCPICRVSAFCFD